MADARLGSKYASLLEMNILVEKNSQLHILQCRNLFPLLIMLYITLSVLYIIVTAVVTITCLTSKKWCSVWA